MNCSTNYPFVADLGGVRGNGQQTNFHRKQAHRDVWRQLEEKGLDDDVFFGQFGKPGGGARGQNVKIQGKLENRFNDDSAVNDNIIAAFGQGCGNPKGVRDNRGNYKQKMVMPKEDDLSKIGELSLPIGIPYKGKLLIKVFGKL